MRLFVIADASKRKARPIGVLFWEADPASVQGRFSLELASTSDEDSLPLSLSFCARRESMCATPAESEEWVRSRIVPEDRHNIDEVLRANGLSEYDVVSLLALSQGRSSDDDYLAYEIDLPDRLAAELAAAQRGTRADRVIEAVKRQRRGPKVTYAFVSLPESEEPLTAAQLIGAQIKQRRLSAGITQKELAASAGISQTVLSRVESGKRNPTLSLLEEIASALNAELLVTLSD